MLNKNTLIGIVVSVIFLGGIVWAAKISTNNNVASVASPATQSSSKGVLTAEEIKFDFGTISMGRGNVTHAYKIKNVGSETVAINRVYTSCMCTTAKFIKGSAVFGPFGMAGHGYIPTIDQELKPGEEAIIEATFDPTAHGPAGVGKIERVIIVENNAGKPFELGFSATVTP